MTSITLVSIIILIVSVVLHEFAHGFAAYKLGDRTAQREGRLTLNPLVHLHWFGSVVLPLMLASVSPVVFGYAKPVPYNPYNLSNRRWGELIVALAGPVSNILIALVFGLLLRFGVVADAGMVDVFITIVYINIALFVFNLVPIAPLDGSKILYAAFPQNQGLRTFLERYSLAIFLIFVFFGWRYIAPIVIWLFNLLVVG